MVDSIKASTYVYVVFSLLVAGGQCRSAVAVGHAHAAGGGKVFSRRPRDEVTARPLQCGEFVLTGSSQRLYTVVALVYLTHPTDSSDMVVVTRVQSASPNFSPISPKNVVRALVHYCTLYFAYVLVFGDLCPKFPTTTRGATQRVIDQLCKSSSAFGEVGCLSPASR